MDDRGEISDSLNKGLLEAPSACSITEAHADRILRARRHACDCVVLAIVTTSEISADLIDLAIEHARNAAADPQVAAFSSTNIYGPLTKTRP